MLNSSFIKLFAVAATVLGDATLARPSSSPTPGRIDLGWREVAHLNGTNTWLENVVSLENGDLLITMLSPSASVYTVKDPASAGAKFSPVYTFDDVSMLIGLAETSPHTVVISAGSIDSNGVVPGSMTVRELSVAGDAPVARKITDIPEAELLNGMTYMPGCEPVVLIADCSAGVVYRVVIATGEYEKILDVPETKRAPGSNKRQYGVNGVKIYEGYLYWSNSDLHTFYRVQIDKKGYPIEGAAVETLATVNDVTFLDDFAIDSKGTMWAATNYNNSLVAIRSDGTQKVIPGGSSELSVMGNTAAALGRAPNDREVLYVVTTAQAMEGTDPEPAKVMAVDTRRFYSYDDR